MTDITEVIQKQEPYLKMEMEKKTGKFASVLVKVTFLCDPGQFKAFQTQALEDLRDTLNVLQNMEEPE